MRTTVQNIGKTKQHKTREDAPPGLGEDISQHFPLVWSIARSFAREKRETHRDDSDAFGEGLLHLLKALETYDETRGTKLETWIVEVVRTGLLMSKRAESAQRRTARFDYEADIETAENRPESYPLEDVETLGKLIGQIEDKKQRDIAVLHFSGYSWVQIGRKLNRQPEWLSFVFRTKIVPQLRTLFLV